MQSRVDALDRDNLYYKYTVFEEDCISDILELIVFQIGFGVSVVLYFLAFIEMLSCSKIKCTSRIW